MPTHCVTNMMMKRRFLSARRRRKGWVALMIERLSWLSWSHALKHLLPTICFVIVLIYGQGDKLQSFVTSIFIPQYHYPYPVAICFAQVLVSLLFLNLLHAVGVVSLKSYSRPLGERLLVPAICGSVNHVLAMWAKASTSYTGLYPLTLPLLPIVTVVLSFSLKLVSLPSIHISVLTCIMSGTSFIITASHSLASDQSLEYIYAPLALVLHSCYLTWLAKVSEAERCKPVDTQASVFDIYYTQLVNQSWMLGLLWLVHPDSPWQVLSHSSWRTLLFNGYLLAILLLGMVLNFTVGISTMYFSPLAGAVLHSARPVLQPFLHLL
ncbi:uncharacterized protein V6R79_004622 [Siganus canaliculatus]